MPTVAEQIEHLKGYDPNMPCAMHLWTPDDVKAQAKNMGRKEPTEEQCANILDRMENKCDSSIGMNWDVLECRIDEECEEVTGEANVKK